jgi:arylsulfatase A-like enzyme
MKPSFLSLFLAFTLPFHLCAAAPPAPRPPNILFLFTDDQRHDTIHALGCAPVVTPNLDRLAHEGTAFLQACIMGGTSGAVCVPSRAMLMTGRSLFRLNNKIGGFLTWPQWFKQHDYVTFMAGKWHNEQPAFRRSFQNAAAVYFGGMGKAKHAADGGEAVEITVQDYDGRTLTAPQLSVKDATELIADAAIKFIEGYKQNKPFLAYIAFTSPHDPRVAPKEFRDLYDPAKLALPPNFLPEHPFNNGELKVRDELLAKFPRTPAEIRQHLADYYACISWADHNIGRILAALRNSGRADNTLVVFAGDNGLALGQHGLLGKQNVYEHSVRVPLLLTGPGVPKDRRTEGFCYLMDLFPTLCDLARLPKPEGLEGISLAPVLRGDKPVVREELFFAYRDLQRAVRTPQFKLIEYSVLKEPPRTQLFDLAQDPWETRNLAADSQYSEVLKSLHADLADWQKRLDDPLPKSDFSQPWMSRYKGAAAKAGK